MENLDNMPESAEQKTGGEKIISKMDVPAPKKRRRRRKPARRKQPETATLDVMDSEAVLTGKSELAVESEKVEQTDKDDNEQSRSYRSKRRRKRRPKKDKSEHAEEQTEASEPEKPRKDRTKRILINARYAGEKRVAIVEGNSLVDFYVESTSRQQLKGNIYKGIVVSILPALQAAFVDFGQKKHGFLQLREIMPEFYKDKQEGKRKIQNALTKGQEIIVQVEKDEHDTKGASLTTYISIPGRYIVMMPGQKRIGISRKIENREDRDRLKEIFNSLKLPDDMGFILRTACSDSIEKELSQDLKYLTKLWDTIKADSDKSKAPALIYKEHDIAMRTVRDYLTTDVAEIVIDDKDTFAATKSFLKKIIPGRKFNVIHYKDKKALSSLYNIEAQIAKLSDMYVNLPSRGYLVFGKTEALTAIDVNSGRGKKEDNIEATALNTNLEAVDEIARQLRLRDIGGLVVVDFIDMESGKNRRLIEQRMADAMSSDKANTEVAPLSKFCILEMTRERIRPAYAETISKKCPLCNGVGTVKSDESVALAAMRELHDRAAAADAESILCRLSVESANILVNSMRRELSDIEKDYDIMVSVIADVSVPAGQYVIELQKKQQ
jgi:ribonuclease E